MTEPANIMNLLIVDDNIDDCMLYSRVLHKSADINYKISEARDGEEGLRLIAELKPHCVLLDYSLPGRNGVEVLKRIRVTNPHLPVVMLTGMGNENVAVTAIQEGAQNYISKSNITPESLQRAIRVAIEHCSLQKRVSNQRGSLEIFTRALAHDLKEPIRTISSFLNLMENHEATFTPRGKTYFDYIQKAADRMNTLIDTVHLYTRLDDPELTMEKENCSVINALEEVKENLSVLINERKASIIIADDLPEVNANRVHLTQLLQNLIINSIRHSERVPVIEITGETGEKFSQFHISDNGRGIDAAQQAKVFEPFKRLSQGKEQGLGLGLAICKKIVESHGGGIWYESSPERGTTFHFTLPVAGVSRKEKAAETAKLQTSSGICTIMLVEDNDADIELTRIMLIEEPKLQCNLLIARDGMDALGKLTEEFKNDRPVDLILLDINMPGIDGFEFLQKLRATKHLNNIPVIMCTTSTFDKDIERAKALGAAGYMTKPAELAKLRPVIAASTSMRLQQDAGGMSLRRVA